MGGGKKPDKKMTTKEIAEIALTGINKGYSWDTVRYCDDLYDATTAEIELCRKFYREIKEGGTNNFIMPED